MNETSDVGVASSGPWTPGIESPVPDHLRHLCTVFRPENAFTSWPQARELVDLTGLEASDLAALRPQRLALHELLIRVTADYSVPDGPRIEDLGINFRRIVARVLAHYVAPEMSAIASSCDAIRGRLATMIDAELKARVQRVARAHDPTPPRSPARRLLGLAPGRAARVDAVRWSGVRLCLANDPGFGAAGTHRRDQDRDKR